MRLRPGFTGAAPTASPATDGRDGSTCFALPDPFESAAGAGAMLERPTTVDQIEKMPGKELGEGEGTGQELLDKQGELPPGLEKWDLPGMEHTLGMKGAMANDSGEGLLSSGGASIGDEDCLTQGESFIPDSLALEPMEVGLELEPSVEQGPITVKFVTQYSKFVGVSCDGEDGKLSDVFGVIIADNEGNGKEVGEAVEAHVEKKGTRELNNLYSSVNYEVHSRSTLRDRNKGRANRVINEA